MWCSCAGEAIYAHHVRGGYELKHKPNEHVWLMVLVTCAVLYTLNDVWPCAKWRVVSLLHLFLTPARTARHLVAHQDAVYAEQ